jgi:hypothetical protein
MFDIKIGDKVKYDNDNSNFTWYGNIVKITKKYFLINSGGVIERVSKNKIVGVY